MSLEPGATAEVSMVVTPDRTADAMGNRGVHVLATPFLVGDLTKFIDRAMRKGQR